MDVNINIRTETKRHSCQKGRRNILHEPVLTYKLTVCDLNNQHETDRQNNILVELVSLILGAKERSGGRDFYESP